MRVFTAVLMALALTVTAGYAMAQEKESVQTQKAAANVGMPVNLNSATSAQLEALPGIGAKTAERIIDYRQKNGGFKKVEDLMNVRGVGEKNFLKLKPLITVAAARTERASQ